MSPVRIVPPRAFIRRNQPRTHASAGRNDLNNVWRRYLEEEKKDGGVVSYRMFANAFPRQGEPDLFLAVEYANWAAFDRGAEYFEKMAEKVQGSADAAREASVDWGALRGIGTNFVLQEVKFRK